MNDKVFTILLGFITLGAIIAFTTISTFQQIEYDRMEMMLHANLCNDTPTNDRICGASVLNPNGTQSKYEWLHLANGTNVKSDCLVTEYPRSYNNTHFACSDGVWKTLEDLKYG